ncbi:MAG: hypothetical protein Q8L22_04395, partial [Reyranella sp.]|nr:hypothetical protein [Reyranella sp.]
MGQTLGLLDTDFSAVAKAFGSRKFALWVGSGISFARAPSLGKLIGLTIEYLRSQVTTNDENDKFAVGLKKILQHAGMDDASIKSIDYALPFSSWPCCSQVTNNLWSKYSSMLDVRIKGEPDDFLLWTAVDVRKEYGGLSDPDCEHLAIALLVLEGAVADIASANWDGLIEIAVDQLSPTGRTGILQVVVDPQDVRDASGRATLVKFHGCAVLSSLDPAAYRKFLVATR